jgi:hypothetical protein
LNTLSEQLSLFAKGVNPVTRFIGPWLDPNNSSELPNNYVGAEEGSGNMILKVTASAQTILNKECSRVK